MCRSTQGSVLGQEWPWKGKRGLGGAEISPGLIHQMLLVVPSQPSVCGRRCHSPALKPEQKKRDVPEHVMFLLTAETPPAALPALFFHFFSLPLKLYRSPANPQNAKSRPVRVTARGPRCGSQGSVTALPPCCPIRHIQESSPECPQPVLVMEGPFSAPALGDSSLCLRFWDGRCPKFPHTSPGAAARMCSGCSLPV